MWINAAAVIQGGYNQINGLTFAPNSASDQGGERFPFLINDSNQRCKVRMLCRGAGRQVPTERMVGLRLLLIDDEVKFVQALKQTLVEHQMLVDVAYDGVTGLDLAYSGTYDLLIVDVMLPGLSGFEIIRTLREQGDSTPMLLLTARDAVSDRVMGLDCGADDYLVKPFATEELLARVRALTRRIGKVGGTDTLSVGPFHLNLVTRTLTCQGAQMALTGKEFQLMELFLRNQGQVLPKVLIFDRVWGNETTADLNVVEIYVHMLRKKISACLRAFETIPPAVIETIRGVGYVFRCVSEKGK